MMTLLLTGTPYTLTQNVVYALPQRVCSILGDVEVEVSPVATNSGYQLTSFLTQGGQITSALFVRCTTGNANILLKPE